MSIQPIPPRPTTTAGELTHRAFQNDQALRRHIIATEKTMVKAVNGALPDATGNVDVGLPDLAQIDAMQAVLDDYQAGQDATDSAMSSVVASGPQTRAALDQDYRHPPPNTALWEPPAQDDAHIDLPAWKSARRLAEQWDPLVAAHPSWVTKTQIATDASGTLPIWLYDFNPGDYDKTIIVNSGMHGYEWMGTLAAADFFRLMAEGNEPALAYARHRVRWLVVPMQNPWGMDNGQTRGNANGVDLNRNADWRWSAGGSSVPGDPEYKGTAPWSEPEAVAVRDLIADHAHEAVAFIDVHDTGGGVPANPDQFTVFTPSVRLPADRDWILRIINALRNPGEKTYVNPSSNSQIYNWALAYHGLQGCIPEYDQQPPVRRDWVNRTRALRWYGNVFLEATRLRRARELPPQPFSLVLQNIDTVQLSEGATPQVIPKYTLDLPVPGPGIVTWNGSVEILSRGVGGERTAQMTSFVGQKTGWAYGPSLAQSLQFRNRLTTQTDMRVMSWANSGVVSEYDNHGGTDGNVTAGLAMSWTGLAIDAIRIQAVLTYIPSADPNRYQRFTATGRPGPERTWPTWDHRGLEPNE